ncbi:hypothetical protein BCR43DRAFT_493765 [Syncephalastrum racemosum]|uniref:Pentatricopeptide repeat-containing protein-mitochondrial domain-containing protein n=1 Tax=Syncephalastrum racemosum TaxID=13706 RepID=A0A1X2HB35_SYNRA|nr:hypothetical protein BCR43DRAFT_493765 [Syncephalastrum racemosum]
MATTSGAVHITRLLWRRHAIKAVPTPLVSLSRHRWPLLCHASTRLFFAPMSTTAAVADNDVIPSRRKTTPLSKPKSEAIADLRHRLRAIRKEPPATVQELETILHLFQHPDVQNQLQHIGAARVDLYYRCVAEAGSLKLMEKVYTTLPRVGFPVSMESMEWVMVTLLKANHIKRAYGLLQDMYRTEQTPTIQIYNHLLKAYAKQFNKPSRRKQAQALLQDMMHHGVQPTAQSYIQLLMGNARYCHRPIDTQTTLAWFESLMKIEARQDYQKTLAKLNTLLGTMATRGDPALPSILNLLLDGGLSPDLKAAIRITAGTGHPSLAEQIFHLTRRRRRDALGPDTYNTLVTGYLRPEKHVVNLSSAIRIFQIMIQDGIQPTTATYERLLTSYAAAPELDDESMRFAVLGKLWQAIMETSHVAVGAHIVAPLLQCYLKYGKLAEAEQVYWDLRQRNNPMPRRTLGWMDRVVSGFADRLYMLSAFSILYDALVIGHWPETQTLCKVIRACGKRDDMESAEQLLVIMLETQQEAKQPRKISSMCYATMVQTYLRCGEFDKAVNMYFNELTAKMADRTDRKRSLALRMAAQRLRWRLQVELAAEHIPEIKAVRDHYHRWSTRLQRETQVRDAHRAKLRFIRQRRNRRWWRSRIRTRK